MNYQCGYCHRYFSREGAFIKHECKTMKRAREIQTLIGQQAYILYSKWMRSYNRGAPTIQVFSTSKYYTTFINFAQFSNRVQLSNIDAFITLMAERQIQPSLWMDDKVYVLYIEYLDRCVDPMTRIETMVTELQDLSEEFECDIGSVMDLMTPGQCADLIRNRTFTPWMLPHMAQFKRVFKRSTAEQRTMLEDLIRPGYWQIQFDKFPQYASAAEQICKELQL